MMTIILSAAAAASLASCGQPQVEHDMSRAEDLARFEQNMLDAELSSNQLSLWPIEEGIIRLHLFTPTTEAEQENRTRALTSQCRLRTDLSSERVQLLNGKPDMIPIEAFELRGKVDDICQDYADR